MESKKCQNCGADIAQDTSFCPYCGANAGQSAPQPQSQQEQPYQQPYAAPQQPPYGAPQQPPYAAPQQPYGQQAPYGQQVPYGQPPYGQPGYEQKSKLVAGLLGIFLGSLGIHNFYLGYKNKALIQLLVSLLTCGFAAFAMGIWGLVEGIQILTGSIAVDANGIPLKD